MNTHINVRMAAVAALAASVIMIGAVPARSQTSASASARPDGRWTPYLGCWRLLAENVRNRGIDNLQSATQNAATPAMTVCVEPSGTSTGVRMTTFADGKQVLEQTIVADNAGHPVSESGCAGTQTSDWSRDGLRLFTRVELACSNRPTQTVSGLTLFAKGPAWVDIQAMQTDGDQQVRIRRYVRALDAPLGVQALPEAVAAEAAMAAQSSSTSTMSQEDVMEASAKVASQAVEAAIVESQSRFNLNSRALLQLADAGVSPNVIDLMVAQSFPSHFRVERPVYAPVAPIVSTLAPPSVGAPGAIYPYPYTYDPYDPYGYYGSYYSPFAYSYYWGNPYYSNYDRYYISNGNSTVIVNGGSGGSLSSGSGGGSGGSAVTTSNGTVVNGQGYTRVHTGSEADAPAVDPNAHPTTTAPRTVSATGDASGSSPSTSTPSTSSSSDSSSSSSGVSNSGYSGGGGDTGRTAQPR